MLHVIQVVAEVLLNAFRMSLQLPGMEFCLVCIGSEPVFDTREVRSLSSDVRDEVYVRHNGQAIPAEYGILPLIIPRVFQGCAGNALKQLFPVLNIQWSFEGFLDIRYRFLPSGH